MNPERGAVLARWARACIRERFGAEPLAAPDAPWCEEVVATFVKLRWHSGNSLQGCIGTIRPARAIHRSFPRGGSGAAGSTAADGKISLK